MLLLNLIQVTESISGSVVPLAMFKRGLPNIPPTHIFRPCIAIEQFITFMFSLSSHKLVKKTLDKFCSVWEQAWGGGCFIHFMNFEEKIYCDGSSVKKHNICQMYSFSADLDICLYIFAFVYLHPNIWYLGTNAHPLEGAGQSTNHRLYQIPNTKSVIYFQSVSAQCFMFYSDLNFLYINEIFKAIWHIWMGVYVGIMV